jgi:hypothetical protein
MALGNGIELEGKLLGVMLTGAGTMDAGSMLIGGAAPCVPGGAAADGKVLCMFEAGALPAGMAPNGAGYPGTLGSIEGGSCCCCCFGGGGADDDSVPKPGAGDTCWAGVGM